MTCETELAQRRTTDRREPDDARGQRARGLRDVPPDKLRGGTQFLRRLEQLRKCEKPADGTILGIVLCRRFAFGRRVHRAMRVRSV